MGVKTCTFLLLEYKLFVQVFILNDCVPGPLFLNRLTIHFPREGMGKRYGNVRKCTFITLF